MGRIAVGGILPLQLHDLRRAVMVEAERGRNPHRGIVDGEVRLPLVIEQHGLGLVDQGCQRHHVPAHRRIGQVERPAITDIGAGRGYNLELAQPHRCRIGIVVAVDQRESHEHAQAQAG